MPAPPGFESGIGPPIYPRWLFHYYATHLRILPAPSFIIDTSSVVERKQRAIAAYRSQFELNPKNRGVPVDCPAGRLFWLAHRDRRRRVLLRARTDRPGRLLRPRRC